MGWGVRGAGAGRGPVKGRRGDGSGRNLARAAPATNWLLLAGYLSVWCSDGSATGVAATQTRNAKRSSNAPAHPHSTILLKKKKKQMIFFF